MIDVKDWVSLHCLGTSPDYESSSSVGGVMLNVIFVSNLNPSTVCSLEVVLI